MISSLIVQMDQALNNSLFIRILDAKSQCYLVRILIPPSKLSNLKRLTQHGHMDKSPCIHTDDRFKLEQIFFF